MSKGQSQEPQKSFEARLAEAKSKTETAQAKTAANRRMPTEGLGYAVRIGTELVVALGVGVFIGWALDKWLETTPWMMVVFFFLGAGAGMLNVFRLTSGVGYDTNYGDQEDDLKGDTPPSEGNEDPGRRV